MLSWYCTYVPLLTAILSIPHWSAFTGKDCRRTRQASNGFGPAKRNQHSMQRTPPSCWISLSDSSTKYRDPCNWYETPLSTFATTCSMWLAAEENAHFQELHDQPVLSSPLCPTMTRTKSYQATLRHLSFCEHNIAIPKELPPSLKVIYVLNIILFTNHVNWALRPTFLSLWPH